MERVEDLEGPELVQEHLRDHKTGPSETALPETGVSPPASSGLYTEAWWRVFSLTAHQRDVPAAVGQTEKHFRG